MINRRRSRREVSVPRDSPSDCNVASGIAPGLDLSKLIFLVEEKSQKIPLEIFLRNKSKTEFF